jgi:hypothetical protein
MKHSTAKALMNCMDELGDTFNRATVIVDEIENLEEQREFRRHLGELISHVVAITGKVVKRFPDLDPDNGSH